MIDIYDNRGGRPTSRWSNDVRRYLKMKRNEGSELLKPWVN